MIEIDRQVSINSNLDFIKETLKQVLPNDVIMAGIVYRPFDMGVLGSKGYSFVLAIPGSRKRMGWSSLKFTDTEIKKATQKILKIWEGIK